MKKCLVSDLGNLVLVLAFGIVLQVTAAPSKAQAHSVMQDDTVYQIFVRSFRDSNGDGNGDLNGIRQEIPYLRKLGITTVLLTPLYDSDFYHNYFAKDFHKIDPSLGTEADFLRLVKALHQNGMKIVIDVEIQYVAGGHPWLVDSKNNPSSAFSDYVLYNDKQNSDPEGFLGAHIFSDYRGHKTEIATANVLDPKAQAYHLALFKYWQDPNGDGRFDDGIDGLRIDHMMDDLDNKGRQTHLFTRLWAPMFTELRRNNPSFVVIGEQAEWSDIGTAWMEEGKTDAVFGFRLRGGLLSFDKAKTYAAIEETGRLTPIDKSIVTFLENHDVSRFSSEVQSNPGKERVGAAFDLLLAGVPLIYYGQEIGSTGKFTEFGATDGNGIPVREAMRWSKDAYARGTALWYKGTGPWWDGSSLQDPNAPSVASQDNDPDSLLNFYRHLSALRGSNPALRHGSQVLLENTSDHVVSWLRADAADSILVAINLSARAESANIALPQGLVMVGSDLLTGAKVQDSSTTLVMPAFGVVVVRLRSNGGQ